MIHPNAHDSGPSIAKKIYAGLSTVGLHSNHLVAAKMHPFRIFAAAVFMEMDTIHIIKIGGAVVNDKSQLNGLLQDLAEKQLSFILVHGGGRKVNEWLHKIGMQPHMVDGRRVTDAATLELAVMNYAGSLNKGIVAKLQSLGVNALGLTGADLNCIRATKRQHPTVDFGFVGDVTHANGQVFWDLCHAGITPVCCAITHDQEGQLLNTNADTIACEIAIALSGFVAVNLWYAFEIAGVLQDLEDPKSLIPVLSKDTYQRLASQGIINSGMIPKLDNCFHALAGGVLAVTICDVKALEALPHASGTSIIK